MGIELPPITTFAVEVEDGIVVRAAPIGRWMVGKPITTVQDWVNQKHGATYPIRTVEEQRGEPTDGRF